MITVAISNTCKDDMESCKSAVYWKKNYKRLCKIARKQERKICVIITINGWTLVSARLIEAEIWTDTPSESQCKGS